MKVVVNRCFGGFGLSGKAIKRYLELTGRECYFYEQTKYSYKDGKDEYSITNEDNGGMFVTCSTKYLGDKIDKVPKEYYFYYGNIERTDENLIKVVEELGYEADGRCASLEVVEIPNDIEWEIDDYDGQESVHEVHRSW
jgi:hypothetical protein